MGLPEDFWKSESPDATLRIREYATIMKESSTKKVSFIHKLIYMFAQFAKFVIFRIRYALSYDELKAKIFTRLYRIKLRVYSSGMHSLSKKSVYGDYLMTKGTYMQLLNISVPLICFVFCTR